VNLARSGGSAQNGYSRKGFTQSEDIMKLILQIIFMPYKLFLLLKLRRAEAKLEKIEAEIVDWLIINDRIQSRIRELALEQAELN
jgi:hypothetical protein